MKERLKTYMLKAVREAKERTSWINPDAEYEAALDAFIAQSLASDVFLKDVNALVPRLARIGMLVGLSQAVLKVASPGIPDYYQGTELWDFSLVDPDNRRPVDFGLRKRLLEGRPSMDELMKDLSSGTAKMHVIRAGLLLRKEMPQLFLAPQYTPLYADGGMEERICAFALRNEKACVVAVAPRLFAAMVPDEHAAPVGAAWGEARLALPDGWRSFENVLTGERHHAENLRLRLADVLRDFPVALLKSAP